MRAVVAFTCAAGLALTAVTAAGQAGSSQSPAQTQPQQQQQQKPQAQTGPQTGQTVMMTGCVYQASDEPALFAIRRMDEGSGSAAATAGSTGAASQSAAGAGSASNQARGGATGTTGTSGGGDGAWYRLAPGAQQDLKQYTGQRVRINGRVTPGKDEKGVDVIIHRIQPDRTVVTAVDLKPAPQLSITSVTPIAGTCEMKKGQD